MTGRRTIHSSCVLCELGHQPVLEGFAFKIESMPLSPLKEDSGNMPTQCALSIRIERFWGRTVLDRKSKLPLKDPPASTYILDHPLS